MDKLILSKPIMKNGEERKELPMILKIYCKG